MPIAVAHILRWYKISKNGLKANLFSLKIICVPIFSLIAFVLGTPFAILDWHTFITSLISGGKNFYSGGFWEHGAFYPFTSLLVSMGYPLGILSLLGLGYALLRRRPQDLLLLSMPVILGCFLMLFKTKDSLWMLIAFPVLCIISASLLVDTIFWIARTRLLQTVLFPLMTIITLIIPAKASFLNSYKLTLPNTCFLSKEWVEENIPPGSKIVMDTGKYYTGKFGPPLSLSRWTLKQFIERGELVDPNLLYSRPDGMRPSGNYGEAEYFRQYLNAIGDRPGYDIIQILHDPGAKKAQVLTLDEYISMGVQYAIVSSEGWGRYFPSKEESLMYPDKAVKYRNFYEELRVRSTLLKEFNPSSKMQGPSILIYKIL